MHEQGIRDRELVSMKGTPRSVFAVGKTVQIWCSSPTGDSSDSHLYAMPCLTEAQAETIAETWRKVWGLPHYN